MRVQTGPRHRCALVLVLPTLLPVLGCSHGTEPAEPATLLVVNATCDAGPCQPLMVAGFPATQPHTPGGFWSVEVGFVSGPTACLTLPSSSDFDAVNAASGARTTYTWTEDEPIALAAIEVFSSRLLATPTTDAFVPRSARGWRVTLPGGGPVTSDAPCDPDGQP